MRQMITSGCVSFPRTRLIRSLHSSCVSVSDIHSDPICPGVSEIQSDATGQSPTDRVEKGHPGLGDEIRRPPVQRWRAREVRHTQSMTLWKRI